MERAENMKFLITPITALLLAALASLSLNAQEFLLGEARTLPEPKPTLSIYDYAPDGHYTCLLYTSDAADE